MAMATQRIATGMEKATKACHADALAAGIAPVGDERYVEFQA